MAPSRAFTYCEGAPSWKPATYIADAALQKRAESLLANDNLQSAIAISFALPPPSRDRYVYHAIVSVTLPEVQHVISLGGQNGLHAWYFAPAPPSSSDDTKETKEPIALPPPPRPDIEAYLSIFDPNTSTPAALKTFASNAKKGSLRAEIAAYLLSKRYLHPSLAASLTVPKRAKKKKATTTADTNTDTNKIPPNPYLLFLNWSARALEWAGPSPSSALGGNRAHHALPVLMHHFGCACPSHEALSILRVLAVGRGVLDVGSGGGYWTFMLRSYGVDTVPVDSAQSAWRATWVSDTVITDGEAWLRKRRKARAQSQSQSKSASASNPDPDPDEAVLLLVYPIVGGELAGGQEGGFTRRMIDAYGGDTLAVVGTQNRNGYTGFRGLSMDEYMAKERSADGWVKVVQVALPSFPGKDEALFVFQRGPRAPARDAETAAAGEVGDRSSGSGGGNDNK
ncbi:hypothetical protein F4677DRAFT_441896 [Hypoxylon crocopeplum]|nr:hypothetical protein F4677DRAFT_441896 [Hypoxylon crocopeplum]